MKPSGHDIRPHAHDEKFKCDRPSKCSWSTSTKMSFCVDRSSDDDDGVKRNISLGDSDRQLHTWPSSIKAGGRSEGGVLCSGIVVVDLHGIRYFTTCNNNHVVVGGKAGASATKKIVLHEAVLPKRKSTVLRIIPGYECYGYSPWLE